MTEQEMFEQWLKDEDMWFKDFSQYKADEFNDTADLPCIHAENLKLRDALDTLLLIVGLTAFKHEGQMAVLQDAVDIGYKALAETPEHSLQAHDDEVIERCAVVADGYIGCDCLARDIRELKGKQNE